MEQVMIFGEVAGPVGRAFIPINEELLLVNTILDPKEAHVNGLRAVSAHGTVGNPSHSGVVHLDRCRAVGEAKFLKHNAKNHGILAVMEQPANFAFMLEPGTLGK